MAKTEHSVTPGLTGGLVVDLYVWDNDSTDGSADFVEAEYPQAKLVRSADNLGFSIPNNKGMQYALDKGYDYVYLLNQDAWLEPGALEKLVAVADAHPEYGLLSPMQMTDGYKGLDEQFAKRLPVKPAMTSIVSFPVSTSSCPAPTSSCPVSTSSCPAPTSSFPVSASSCPAPTGHLIEVPFVMAAHWLVPTRVIRKVGLFNEELFPHWGQDDDWCQRLDFYGLKIGVVEEARGVHDRATRQESVEKLVKRNYYTGSLIRLCDVRRPLWERFFYVLLFTAVKSIKYRSLLPFKYLRTIVRQLPQVRNHRAVVRARA
jgi:GT2 family glycosyltransferase